VHVVVYAAATDSITARLLAATAAAAADRCTLVRVRAGGWPRRVDRIRGLTRKARKRGAAWTARKLAFAPLERALRTRLERAIERALADHPLAEAAPRFAGELWVESVNHPDAAALLRRLAPDVILQNGAGLLAEPIFTAARLGTWNLHHGYLPAIRGGDSLLWALREGRPDWVGCSLHVIDRGIDTGPLLARRRVDYRPGEHPGAIFARLTCAGVELLRDGLAAARAGDRAPYLAREAGEGRGGYRSMLDGRQLAELWWRAVHPVAGESATTRPGSTREAPR
jgi:hypothetical protein